MALEVEGSNPSVHPNTNERAVRPFFFSCCLRKRHYRQFKLLVHAENTNIPGVALLAPAESGMGSEGLCRYFLCRSKICCGQSIKTKP